MKNNFWAGKKVLVTGGTGFIGSHVVENLLGKGASVSVIDNLQNGKIKNISYLADKVKFIQGDCTNINDALKACQSNSIVMNLAARVGGIGYNQTHQAQMLRDNLNIATTMIEAARRSGVERFLVVSSACVYPHTCSIPTPESEGFAGEPEPTNGGYGWAKRMAEKLGEYYAKEYAMQVAIVRPYNCYGPRDHFDPNTSHVIPALIKRIFDGENPVSVWGSGKQTRAFLYVEDLAEGMILATERYCRADPINLGTDDEIKIKDLVNLIIKLSGKNISARFDLTKPDGSPRRNSDNRKAKRAINFKAGKSLTEGLTKTIAWYKEQYS